MVNPSETGSGLQSRGFLLQVLDALPAAAYTCDVDGLITYFNRSAVDVWGREPKILDETDRYCGSYRLFYTDGSPMPHDQCWMALTIQKQAPHNSCEVVIERPDGSLRSALAHANPLRCEAGDFIGAANVLIDITDRKRFEELLAHKATHDPLTALPNRALFLQRLEQAISQSESEASTFTLLMLDLNRFKEINDNHGHEYGDEVLKLLRPRILDCVRRNDTVARLGGDEFGVLLPASDLEGAARVAEAILSAWGRPLVVGSRTFEVGVSIGIVQYPCHGRDTTTLLRHADTAMYAAKRSRSGPLIFSTGLPTIAP